VRGFTTLLLGYHFAAEAQARAGRDQSTLDLFLKFEQLAAYSRFHVNRDREFRGSERVMAFLEKSRRITIGANPSHQILGDQKIYGLWGLFSVAARESGLLAQRETLLTSTARNFVERHYISRLTSDGFKDGRRVVDVLSRDHSDVHLEGRDSTLANSLAAILSPRCSAAERSFYHDHLASCADNDKTDGCQTLLTRLLTELDPRSQFGMAELELTKGRASRDQDGELLASHLAAIASLESLLVPMNSAFGFLLTRDRQSIESVAGEIRAEWGRSLAHVDPGAIALLRPRIAAAFHDDAEVAERFHEIALSLRKGRYEDVLRLLLKHNAYVMQTRTGSSPWAIDERGRIAVKYRDESGRLIGGDELSQAWQNTYFINSLKTVVDTLRVP